MLCTCCDKEFEPEIAKDGEPIIDYCDECIEKGIDE